MTTQGSVHIGLGKRVAWAIATLGILIISCQSGPAPLIAGSNLGSIPSTRPVFPVRPGHFDLPPCHIGMAHSALALRTHATGSPLRELRPWLPPQRHALSLTPAREYPTPAWDSPRTSACALARGPARAT